MLQREGLRYHQKATLVENISSYVRDIRAESLLDIGAGSIETALPLSQQVRRYCAIEQDAQIAARLKSAGLDVIHGTFPMPLQGTYDLVLSSHSVPESSIDAYSPFLRTAWGLTSREGMMLIVTFKGSQGSLAALRHELLGRVQEASQEYETIVEHCETFGRTSVHRVNSFVEATRAEDIVEYIGPWLSGSLEQRKEFHDAFVRVVLARFKVREELFVFPTEHLFIGCRKR